MPLPRQQVAGQAARQLDERRRLNAFQLAGELCITCRKVESSSVPVPCLLVSAVAMSKDPDSDRSCHRSQVRSDAVGAY
jgi:hypothetical protein